MTNPTRDQILRAHNALTNVCNLVEIRAGYRPTEYEQVIRAALPPEPQPTMADVEWDDDKHHFAEAEHPIYGKVIMLFQSQNTGNIYFTYRSGGEQCHVYSIPADLAPTGRRYELKEKNND